MPNIDEEARRWELDLAGQVGRAVAARRKRLGLTAVGVAERTKELGYPITRVAISKIENNARAGKIDVAELLVLATALEIPPVLLLFPEFPEGDVEVLPGLESHADAAVRWLSGTEFLPHREGEKTYWANRYNAGIELVEAVSQARDLRLSLIGHYGMKDSRDVAQASHATLMIEIVEDRLDSLRSQVEDEFYDLFGRHLEEASDE